MLLAVSLVNASETPSSVELFAGIAVVLDFSHNAFTNSWQIAGPTDMMLGLRGDRDISGSGDEKT